MRNLAFLLLILCFVACDDTPKEPEQETIPTQNPVEQLRDEGQTISSPEEKQAPKVTGNALQDSIEVLRSQFADIRYGVQVGEKVLLYVSSFKGRNARLGIVDTSGTKLLPIEYEQIGNPDLIAKGWIEVKKDGKYGLFSYETNELIPAEYDIIFPVQSAGQIAIGQQVTRFYALKTGMEREEISQTSDQPRYTTTLPQLSFTVDVANDQLFLLQQRAQMVWEDHDVVEDGRGVYFTPSYLAKLGNWPEKIEQIAVHRREEGLHEAEGRLEKTQSLGDQISAFVTSFYESGVAGREYRSKRLQVSTFDQYNQFIDSVRLFETHHMGRLCFSHTYQFLSDTLIEVRDDTYGPKGFAYVEMPVFRYYQIDESGSIYTLDGPRLWDFTRHVMLTPDYFEGCYVSRLEEGEGAKYGNEEARYLITQHLSVEDLDIMRNEIFAEYGYRFKSQKWQAYFSQFSWYKARFDNVDHLLTDIEKHNVQVILQRKAEMQDDEEAFTQPEATRGEIYAAG